MRHRGQLDLFVTTPEERGPLAGLTVHLPDTCRCGTDVASAQDRNLSTGQPSQSKVPSRRPGIS
jgi:hypothetical protein